MHTTFGDLQPGVCFSCCGNVDRYIKIDPDCEFAIDKNLYSMAVRLKDGVVAFIGKDSPVCRIGRVR